MAANERHEALRSDGGERGLGAPRNETYKHLEDPMRLSGLTLGQWGGLAASALVAIVFGLYVSPLPSGITITLSLFVAGLPLVLPYAVSGFDMAMSETLAAVYRWARGAKHYLPAAVEPPSGYVVVQAPDDERHVARSSEDIAAARRQLEGVWDL
jgi:hypothetical protein